MSVGKLQSPKVTESICDASDEQSTFLYQYRRVETLKVQNASTLLLLLIEIIEIDR
jgi:hypothetical protein